MTEAQNITILGSTGSIGTQTLEIVRDYPDRFRVVALTARDRWQMLAAQAREFRPRRVVIANDAHYTALKEALADTDTVVASGERAISEVAAMPEADTVVTAMVGYSGLVPTIHAIGAGKRIALANKETLVVAGELIKRLLKESQSEIIPVDSEHSAIFQCLVGEKRSELSKIILTASGGPFRTLTTEQLERVTVKDALNHPNWKMGAKVTIDSASMMNKGFEMIEARWLFDCPPSQIEIVVHPQSIVHSMVEFCDGSIKAQLGVPDMRLPIRYALGYPARLCSDKTRLTLSQYASLTFEKPDMEKFPMLGYAFEAVRTGGTMPCIMNAANEVAVNAFLNGLISFNGIARAVRATMEKMQHSNDVSLENLIETNREARKITHELTTDSKWT